SSYTSLGFVRLEEKVLQALLFLKKQMKELSLPFECHLQRLTIWKSMFQIYYSPDQPNISFICYWIFKGDSL
ncbi:Hypothetical protein FKW44_003780, partial [Caligus rogercresseyi]